MIQKNKNLLILFILITILILFFISQFIFKKTTVAPIIENNSISPTSTPHFKGPIGEPQIIGPSSPPFDY